MSGNMGQPMANYAAARRAGDFVFVSGVVAVDTARKVVVQTYEELPPSAREALGAPSTWREPVGLELEIVPERDPTLLRQGDALPVVVLALGRPFARFPLAASDGRERHFLRTDADGRATFRLDRPGRWLIAGTWLRKTDKPDTEWESDFTTLTLLVAAH